MSVGPVSGNGISLSLPPTKTAFWNVNVQAAYQQFVQLCDSTGAVVFTAKGASDGGATQIGSGSFTINNNTPYMLYIGINQGQSWSSVLWDDMTLNLGAKIMCENYIFIAEDATDSDYNDSAVSITWFNTIG